jgi:acyl-coenzyme A synthetase/AMP-(fatty) acid ligase
MYSSIFERFIALNSCPEKQKNHGVEIYGDYASWFDILTRAKNLSKTLKDNTVYVVDSCAGVQSIVCLIAIIMKSRSSFIWAKKNISPSLTLITESLLTGLSIPQDRVSEYPYYGTLTSGTTSTQKIAMGSVNNLMEVGIYYDYILYGSCLPAANEGGTIATCLPLEYSATFMMTILPALFAMRNLLIFKADRWNTVLFRQNKEPIAIVTVPSLLSAACASVADTLSSRHLTFITTAGYLSKKRLLNTKNKFENISIRSVYGASETGIMAIDLSPNGSHHVGKKIFGKSIWLTDVNETGIGKITTKGIDCREFYLSNNANICSATGIVACTDLGHFDEEENLYLDGRVDGGDKLNGITIYPKQIERHLLELNSIIDAKVLIRTADNLLEYIEAIIVGDVNENELRDHCSTLNPSIQPRSYFIRREQDAGYSERGKL